MKDFARLQYVWPRFQRTVFRADTLSRWIRKMKRGRKVFLTISNISFTVCLICVCFYSLGWGAESGQMIQLVCFSCPSRVCCFFIIMQGRSGCFPGSQRRTSPQQLTINVQKCGLACLFESFKTGCMPRFSFVQRFSSECRQWCF